MRTEGKREEEENNTNTNKQGMKDKLGPQAIRNSLRAGV